MPKQVAFAGHKGGHKEDTQEDTRVKVTLKNPLNIPRQRNAHHDNGMLRKDYRVNAKDTQPKTGYVRQFKKIKG